MQLEANWIHTKKQCFKIEASRRATSTKRDNVKVNVNKVNVKVNVNKVNVKVNVNKANVKVCDFLCSGYE